LWATPGCRAALQGLLPMQLCFAALMALLPVIARDLGSGLSGTSQLSSAQGVGAVLGASMVPVLVSRVGRVRTLKIHWVITALIVFSFAVINSMPVALVAICLFGGAFSGVLITFMALMQHHAPAEKRGRVMSIFMACMGPSYGASVAFQSVFADTYGRQRMHATMATLAIVIGIASLAMGAGWHGWRVLSKTGTPVGGSAGVAPIDASTLDIMHPDVGA
jgi:MFS family permease